MKMENSFDPNNKRSWYFGGISRKDATDLLLSEGHDGIFLVRDSYTIPGDYVLCVKEECKVCHYIINKEDDGSGIRYKIGDRFFPDLPSLLSFYRSHYLDTTPLVRPASRKLEQVIAKHDFEGSDPEDLPFRKGEILTIIYKDEEQWWTAKNALDRVGQIPVPYVRPYDETLLENNAPEPTIINNQPDPEIQPNSQPHQHQPKKIESNKTQFARVKQAREPNAYDDTALKLHVGDIIEVTKTNMSGQWEGVIILEDGRPGKRGHFPFNFVEFPIDYEPNSSTSNQNHNNSQPNNIKNDTIKRPD